jgi:RimJ/RimL family protein N-acetyltransferase
MEHDFAVENFKPAKHPKNAQISGNTVILEPIDISKHARELFDAYSEDKEGAIWDYLPYGPFSNFEKYAEWLSSITSEDDPTLFAIVRTSDNKAVGVAAYLRINQADGSVEVGHLNYAPTLQRTKESTEAMYLMMKWAFENGYRRYEWKCNALNKKSRYAAQRLGFSFEGIFRQSNIVKGRNRNTAWFAAIDSEWSSLKKCYESYLSDSNFDEYGFHKVSLSELTKPILFKLDSLEFLNS